MFLNWEQLTNDYLDSGFRQPCNGYEQFLLYWEVVSKGNHISCKYAHSQASYQNSNTSTL